MSLLRCQGWFPLAFSVALVGSTTSAIPALAGGLHDHFARKYDVVQGYIIQGSSPVVAGSTVASIPAQQFQVAVPVQQTQASAPAQPAVAASAQSAAQDSGLATDPGTVRPRSGSNARARALPARADSDDPDGVRARPDGSIHVDARRASDADRSGCDCCGTGPDRPHGRGRRSVQYVAMQPVAVQAATIAPQVQVAAQSQVVATPVQLLLPHRCRLFGW